MRPRQYAPAARLPQTGQPCQKQPCTNTHTRDRGNVKSGEPGRGKCLRHPESPARRNSVASANSVEALPLPRMLRIIAERLALEKMSTIRYLN